MCDFVHINDAALSSVDAAIDCFVNELLILHFKRFSKYAENMTQIIRLELRNLFS